ncbi:MAG: hypothetical protein LBN43_03295 [Oscillospiraceae bacterium]|nr:hypothetical protein [Oscillospiraceae bacterium]
MKKICEFCGKEFTAKNRDAKCCSMECRDANAREKKKLRYSATSNWGVRSGLTREEALALANRLRAKRIKNGTLWKATRPEDYR